MNQNKKVLINGCSHTRADIPDNPSGDPWPTIFGQLADCKVINLAKDGKANIQIAEETIRYLIWNEDIDHVVVQLNEWKRINLFKSVNSFDWVPQDLESQLDGFPFVKIPAIDDKDLEVTRLTGTIDEEVHRVGDKSFVHNIITVGTLVNCISNICQQRGIGLTIINYHALGDCRADPVWQTIPEEHFLIQNRSRGIYNHLLWSYQTPDTFHFEHAAHYEIAKMVYNHCTEGKQIRVIKEDYDDAHRERVFSYE